MVGSGAHAIAWQLAIAAPRNPQKLADEGRGRALMNLVWRPDLLDPSCIQDGNPVGEVERLRLVVRDEDRGDLQFSLQCTKPFAQLGTHLGVERPERLVEQQHPRIDRQGTGKSGALTLAARELRRKPGAEPGKLHQVEQLLDPRRDLRARRALAARFYGKAERDVARYRHMPEQGVVLKDKADPALSRRETTDVLPVDKDRTGIGPIEPGDQAQQGCLTCAGRPEKGEEFAVGDIEIGAGQHRRTAEMLYQSANLHAHGAPSGPTASSSPWRHCIRALAISVTRASATKRAETANAPARLYSL
jgi:hypothetical protein